MNKELLETMEVLEKERNIAKDILIEAIENPLLTAYKDHFGKVGNVKVTMNSNICDFAVYVEKTIVESVGDDILETSLADTKALSPKYEVGDTVRIPLDSKRLGRIATQSAKSVTLQETRKEERKILYNEYYTGEKDVMTGIVRCYLDRNVSINLGRADAILSESEQVKGETFRPTERTKVYVIEVKDTPKGPRVSVSRTYPNLVRCLFESEVAEVRDGTVEIKAVTREAGSGTKTAVRSNDSNVDPTGVCVGLNDARVSPTINGLRREGIDIISWDSNPAYLVENTLSPAKVICMVADEGAREIQVIVPDYRLSLAIDKEGQNARLAAGLTSFKIDIKSETQAREMGLFEWMGLQYGDISVVSLEEETYGESKNYQEY